MGLPLPCIDHCLHSHAIHRTQVIQSKLTLHVPLHTILTSQAAFRTHSSRSSVDVNMCTCHGQCSVVTLSSQHVACNGGAAITVVLLRLSFLSLRAYNECTFVKK